MLPFVLAPAYAEIHYRFRYFFSLLKKREPEIIADVPYRVGRGQTLPVLLLIKDADVYPIFLRKADVFANGRKVFSRTFEILINQHWFETVFDVSAKDLQSGKNEIAIKIFYKVRGKTKVCINDNYRTTSKAPLQCYLSHESLPHEDDFYYGDLHAHSSFTEDQIEFGAGLETMRRMAQAIGLDFFSVTDHSYDLDDLPANYLVNDPQLRKWENFNQQVAQLNMQKSRPIIIPGEELSVGNSKGQNAHLLVLNNHTFIPGKGDSGEQWFHFQPDYFIDQIPDLLDNKALLIPAHPSESVPFFQKMFINRGEWHERDLDRPIFTIIQSINGGSEKEVETGFAQWVHFLLKGRKLTIVAGNDAHGNFARSRQIGIPFVYVHESSKHRFGVWKTGVFLPDFDHRPETILTALKQGHVFVTNGPFVWLEAQSEEKWIPVGGQAGRITQVRITIHSTQEFGVIEKIRLFGGDIQRQQETALWEKQFDANQTFDLKEKISLHLFEGIGYIRCHVTTKTANERYQGSTNAIYLRRNL